MKRHIYLTAFSILSIAVAVVSLGTSSVDAHGVGVSASAFLKNGYKYFEKSNKNDDNKKDDDRRHNNTSNSYTGTVNTGSTNTGSVNTGRNDIGLKAWLLFKMGMWKSESYGRWEHWKNNSGAIAALEANNYTAFQAALGKKGSKITVEQFNSMRVEYMKWKTIINALETKNYNAYVEATKPTQAEFDAVVERYNNYKVKAGLKVQ